MNIGNPINSVPRYAKLFMSGIQGKQAPIPHINTPNTGHMDNAVYNTSLYANKHPYQALGATVGGVAVNNVLGNPLGALIDTATFGLTDFNKVDVEPLANNQIIMTQPQQMSVPQTQYSLPPLDEAERKKQVEYLQRKAATDLITIQALQQQPGMEVYQ